MSVINNKQGAVKASEIAVDNALSIVGSSAREDLMTVESRLANIISDSFKRHFALVLSDGNITWDAPNLIVPAGVKITFQIESADNSAASRYVNCEFTTPSNLNISVGSGNVLYLELSRSNLLSGSTLSVTDGVNAAGIAGRRLKVSSASSLPKIQDLNDGNPQDTLKIPVAYQDGTNFYWINSGQVWAPGTVSQIGINTKVVNVPKGTIVGLHIEGVTDTGVAVTQPFISANYPGWWLCNGSTISYPGSTMNGAASPSLQTRFIRGNTSSGSTSGTDSVTLTIDQIPQHFHTLSTGTMANHQHGIVGADGAQARIAKVVLVASGYNPTLYYWSGYAAGYGYSRLCPTYDATNQTYYRTGQGAATATHRHSMNNNTSGTSHENRPAFVTLVYIIKVV